MAYAKKFRLSIRDKKDWSKWDHSPECDSIDAVFAKYRDWLIAHPGAVVSFTQTTVIIPDPKVEGWGI